MASGNKTMLTVPGQFDGTVTSPCARYVFVQTLVIGYAEQEHDVRAVDLGLFDYRLC